MFVFASSDFEFFRRTVQVNDEQGARWSDLRLTREESIQTEKKFTIFIAQSLDANRVLTVIDDVKVSGENKEKFSWPEELDSAATSSLPVINGSFHSFRPTTDEKDLGTLSLSDQLQRDSRELFKEFFVSKCDWQKHVDRRRIVFRSFLISRSRNLY